MKWKDPIWILVFALTLGVTGLRAQAPQQNPQSATPASPIPPMNTGGSAGNSKPPVGAARGLSPAYDDQAYDPSQVLPDTNTLSGAQLFSVGSLDHGRNILDPSISYSELGQTDTGIGGPAKLGAESIFTGTMNFNRIWSEYHFTAIYNGGGTFAEGPITPNTQYHDLTVSQEIDWERWRLLFRDDFTASPGAAFTGTGMGGPGLSAQLSSTLGSALNGIGQAFLPSESIETGTDMRYRNMLLGEAEYSFSRRSAFTISDSFGILHFTGAGYISSQMLNSQAGYDYLLDPKNSIAILAGFGKIDYTGTVGSTSDYTGAFAYGRKITGRLAFQVGVGPQLIHSLNESSSFHVWLLSVNSALTYDRRRSGVTVSYVRGLSSGSGVFAGAKSDTFSGTAHYQFTRFWTGAVNGGYALNYGLVPAGATATNFTNWFIGANIGREVGRHALINFNYGLQRQNSPDTCPVVSCGSSGYLQTFGMTVNWHLRPAG